MKRLVFLFLPLWLPSCQPISLTDQVELSKPAMSFDQQGADSPECSLVSIIERGRAPESLGAGGGCSSCH
ncbi:hypothetical protein V2O64_10525 [Verrucomicrobiaceae bacterium 227]